MLPPTRSRASLRATSQRVPGIVDSHVFQVPDVPAINVDVDRALASELHLNQRTTADSVLVATNSSAQSAPNFWVDPKSGVSYPLVVQLPTYQINSAHDLWTMPVNTGRRWAAQARSS